MKLFCVIIPFLLSVLHGQKLTFTNGDTLTGKVTEVREGELKLQAESLGTIIGIPLGKVDSITYPEREVKGKRSHTRILLNRGDRYSGEMQEISEDQVVLKTDWAGEIEVDRRYVEAVTPLLKKKNFLGDLSDLSGWKVISGKKPWVVTDDGIKSMSRSMMSKRVNTSDRVHFSTLFRPTTSNSRFRVQLFASEGNLSEATNYLEIAFQSGHITARVRVDGDEDSLGANKELQSLRTNKSHKIEVFANLEAQSAYLYVDGEMIGEWIIPEEVTAHPWIYLSSDYNGEVHLSESKLHNWNGVLPIQREMTSDERFKDSTFIYLENGDLIDAQKVSYENDQLVAQTSLGEVKISMKFIKLVDFQGQKYREAKREKGDLKILLNNGDQVVMQLESWTDNKITGRSQNYGAMTIDADQVSQVQFNIYR